MIPQHAIMHVCTYMQLCNYAYIYKYVSMQVCKYASMYIYASMHILCKHASIQVCMYAIVQVCKYASMQVYMYASLHGGIKLTLSGKGYWFNPICFGVRVLHILTLRDFVNGNGSLVSSLC